MITKLASLIEQAAKTIPIIADDIAIFASTRMGAKNKGDAAPGERSLMRKAKAQAAMLKLARVLSLRGRKRISEGNFAIPETRKYPIHDIAHARNALARVAQYGTPEIQARVRAAVHAKYPKIGEHH